MVFPAVACKNNRAFYPRTQEMEALLFFWAAFPTCLCAGGGPVPQPLDSTDLTSGYLIAFPSPMM